MKALLYLDEPQSQNEPFGHVGQTLDKELSICLLYVIKPDIGLHHLSHEVAQGVAHLNRAKEQLIKQGRRVEKIECTFGIPLEQINKMAEVWSVQQIIIYRSNSDWPKLINFFYQN